MKKNRRFATLLICLILAAAMVMPAGVFGADGEGRYLINGRYVSASDFNSSPNECWVYAQNLYTKIWGERFTNSFYSDDNILRELSEEDLVLNAENLRRYVSAAEPGSVLRITSIDLLYEYSDAAGHSQIIVDKDDNGFTVLEGGMGVWPYRFENYYTWEDYVSVWYNYDHAYIKYIKWPGEHLYTGSYADSCESFPTYLSIIVKAMPEGADEPDQPTDPAAGFRAQPCRPETDASSELISLIPEGTVLTATRLIKNTDGEYWYRCIWEDRTGYIFCAEAESGEDISQTILEEVYVTGTMPSAGTVGCPIDLPITVYSDLLEIAAVEGYIEELDGTRILPDFSNSVSVHRNSIYLYNSYVDNTITFGKLPEGTFRFVLPVTLLYFSSPDGVSLKPKEIIKIFTSEFTMAPPPPPYCAGDLNGDAEVTADDLTMLSRHIARIEPLTIEDALSAADTNHDGLISADDLTLLSRYVSQIITTLE